MLLSVYFCLILVSPNRKRQRVLTSVTDNRNIRKAEGTLDKNQQHFQETWNINRKFLVVTLARTQLKLRTGADNKTTSSNFCYRKQKSEETRRNIETPVKISSLLLESGRSFNHTALLARRDCYTKKISERMKFKKMMTRLLKEGTAKLELISCKRVVNRVHG